MDALCGEERQGKEPGTSGPVFDRSKFVQEVQLDGKTECSSTTKFNAYTALSTSLLYSITTCRFSLAVPAPSLVDLRVGVGSVSINDIFDFSHGESLGKGSYGQVMKARDLKTGTTRAIKVVYKPRIENVTRLKREILIMSVARASAATAHHIL